MAKPITIADPIFMGTWAGDAPPEPFLEHVVNLINRSPALLQEIQAVDGFHLADGSTPRIYMPPTPGVSDDTTYHGASLFVRNLPGYDDSQTILTGGSLRNTDDPVTPAGVFVGDLADALGKWQDRGLQPAATGQLTALTSEQFVALDFASEGKAAYNQFLVKSQIEATEAGNPVPATLANGHILFDNTGNPATDSAEITQLQKFARQDQPLSRSVDYAANQFWNGGQEPTLVTVWNSFIQAQSENYAFPNIDLGIDPLTVTNITVKVNAAGTLIGSTLQTDVSGTLTNYVFRYAATGVEDARAYDAANHLLYDRMIDLSGFTQFHDHYVVRQIQNDGRFNDIAGEQLAVIGNHNQIQGFSDIGLLVNGNNNSVGMVTGAVTVHGNGNTIFPAFNDDGEPFDAAVIGNRNILSMDCGGNATISGAGNVANIGSRPDDPYGLSDTHFIVSSTLGHTVFNAGMGNATLKGGLGGDVFNLTVGNDTVAFGKGHSALTTGSGTATVTGGGSDAIQGGTGGSDLYIAGNHSAEVIRDFRPGDDHVSAGDQQVTHMVTRHGGTLITFSSGATINLIGVTDTGHLFG